MNKEIISSAMSALKVKSPGVKLQTRDYELLQFILEQKFVSLEIIYFRFFDVRTDSSESLPNNFFTVRQRLSKLRSCALIKSEKVLSSGRAHYLLTPFGYRTLLDWMEEETFIKPAKKIDFSLYEHDLRLSLIRAFSEKRGICKRWYSEKWFGSFKRGRV